MPVTYKGDLRVLVYAKPPTETLPPDMCAPCHQLGSQAALLLFFDL